MNSQRLLNTFFNLVKIDSPSRQEAGVSAYCEEVLRAFGFEIYYDNSTEQTGSNTDNLIAYLPGTNGGSNTPLKHISFSAHMDCVDPCLGVEPVLEDGIIHSAGDTVLGADNKAGLAAILEGLQSVIDAGLPRPDITLVFTVCEELSLVGSRALPDDLFEDNIPCFVLDAGGSPGTIVYGAPFHYTIEARFKGKAVHAGVEPEKGRSAIQMAVKALSVMPLGRIDDMTTANIGIIEGGRESNVVPDNCTIKGECRSLYEDRAQAQLNAMIDAMKTAAEELGGSVEIDHHLDYIGVLYEKDDPLIQELTVAVKSVGLEPRLVLTGGGSDANILNAKGADSIPLGIGMTNIHSYDEFISREDLDSCAQLVEALIAQYAD